MRFLKKFVTLPSGIILGALMALAQTPPATVFQLDGNAAQSNGYAGCSYAAPCDNWDLLNGTGVGTGGVQPGVAGHSLVRTFINGTASTNSFTGGGSKDSNLLSQWTYSASPTPNKDTLNAGYAAAYTATNNDFILVFGADRASPSGDANIGIWFFQQSLAPNGSGGFTGAHQDHDIFIISAFTNGGGTSTVSVYEWDHTCSAGVKNPTAGQCGDTNLRILAVPSAVCGNSIYCGITNGVATSTTWEGTLASPLFFEGGVNLTAALAAVGVNQLPCFTSFLEETRSSQSTTAVLKDFVAGGFPVCGLSVSKNCGVPTVVQNGTAVSYPVSGVITNTGVGTLYNVTVFDTPTSPAGATRTLTVTNNVAGSANNGTSVLGPHETGTWSDSTQTTANTTSDSAVAQAGLNSSTTPNGSPTQANTVTSTAATKTCTANFNTSLSINKGCGIPATANSAAVPGVALTVANNVVGLLVSYSGQVCNNGVSQVTGIAVTDTPSSGASSNITIGTLPACTSFDANGNCNESDAKNCTNFSSGYTPTNIDQVVSGAGGPGTGPGRYLWNDAVTITSATATVGKLNKLTSGTYAGTYGGASASCPICQGSGECTVP